MALERLVFLQDPFTRNHNVPYKFTNNYYPSIEHENSKGENLEKMIEQGFTSSTSSSVEDIPVEILARGRRRKRQREMRSRNEEEIEHQRMNHIAVERNRRKQMNEYLSVLRSLMPPSYALRGDQASIVEGTINFVKKLEQFLQFLESHKQSKMPKSFSKNSSSPFANFFTFPQYTSTPSIDPGHPIKSNEGMDEQQSTVADIEVSLVETHATIKILVRRQPKQLLALVAEFYSLGFVILHIYLTRADNIGMVLFSFSVKIGDNCQLSTMNEIATAVHEMMAKIQQEYNHVLV